MSQCWKRNITNAVLCLDAFHIRKTGVPNMNGHARERLADFILAELLDVDHARRILDAPR
ncbi:hypothetical protein AKJ09_04756 [Labilithrix luteola]|uniref:Uncharacterized protein n=1 Tax=Labilithrix luteola TaxID=1391654 RepID=A0A0K1PX47_9BACT|nr:hypothetical protein AKJ09_04756 [Labilithrix luteola]